MKRLLILVFYTFMLTGSCFSQELLVGLRGLIDSNSNESYEYRGLQMTIHKKIGKTVLDKNTVKRVKKTFDLGDEKKAYVIIDEKINGNCQVIESEAQGNFNTTINKTSYILSDKNGGFDLIIFSTHNDQNTELEKTLIQAYYAGALAPYLEQKTSSATEINILGRKFELDYSYGWRSPSHIQSGELNELAWSVFPSYEEAMEDSNNRVKRDKSGDLKISMDEHIDIHLMDKPAIARVITYYPNNKQMPFDRYYIVEEVDGVYISMELTNEIKMDGNRALPMPLKYIVYFDDGDGYTDWLAERDWSELNTRNAHKTYNPHSDFYPIEVRAGAWMPMGDLYSVMGPGPAIDVYLLWFKMNEHFAVDFGLGVYTAIKKEKYFPQKDIYFKSNIFAPLYIRCKYQVHLAKGVYLVPFVGLGVHSVMYDMGHIDEEVGMTTETEYPFAAVGGISFRLKKISVFAEYNHVEYKWKSYLGLSSSKGSLTVGVSYCLDDY